MAFQLEAFDTNISGHDIKRQSLKKTQLPGEIWSSLHPTQSSTPLKARACQSDMYYNGRTMKHDHFEDGRQNTRVVRDWPLMSHPLGHPSKRLSPHRVIKARELWGLSRDGSQKRALSSQTSLSSVCSQQPRQYTQWPCHLKPEQPAAVETAQRSNWIAKNW